jgi:hypothetical protein
VLDVSEVACLVEHWAYGVVDMLVNLKAPLLAVMKALFVEL